MLLKNTVISVLLLFVCTTISAQTDFDKFVQDRVTQFDKFRSDKQAEFDRFRRERNEAFSKMLEDRWAVFHGEKPTEPIQEKPIPPIVYEEPAPSPQPAPTPLPIEEEIVVIPAPEPQPEPIVPIEPIKDQNVRIVTTTFYGTPVALTFPKDNAFHVSGVQDKDIVHAWNTLMEDKFDVVISNALATRDELQLCDWAYVQMLDKLCSIVYGEQTLESEMMLGYLLVQTGYQVRFAHDDKSLYVMFASRNSIYGKPYFIVDNNRFYPIHDAPSSLYISSASFNTEQPISLLIGNEQMFKYKPSDTQTRTSTQNMSVHVCVNKNAIDFYNDYPTGSLNDDFGTRWALYANTPMDKRIRESLYPQIIASVDGYTMRDAVNKILNWVQTAFEYEYDDVVWGGDRAFFASESLYYPYCDCEDRSILFSRLVRDIIGINVVLLFYPGHLATAVDLGESAQGDYVMVNGKKYIVCDPTYIGAPVGETMPDMDNKTAKVIVLQR